MNEANPIASQPGSGVASGARRLTRRDVMRALGAGGVVVAAPGSAVFGVTKTAAQDLGLVATPQADSLKAFDRVGPTVADRAADLRYDLNAIFRFVADEVEYDPYAGALRGANGTNWGLAGNAVDQASLLAALLDEALVETRFVFGELSDGAAERLLASTRQDEAPARAKAARVLAPPPPATDAQTLALTPEEESLAKALPAARQAFKDRIDRQLEEEVSVVEDALASAGITLPAPVVELPERERRRHAWVQYADGPLWIDLDPSIPGSQLGDVHATVLETHERLPDEEHHWITIRLVADQIVSGAPARSELLTFEAPSGNLVGVPITLLHPEAEMLKATGVAITGALTGMVNHVPALVVGNQWFQGKPVTFATGGGALDALSVDGDAGATAEGDTLGEWLEIDLKTPQGERRIVREIFDRVGYAQRQVVTVDLAKVAPVELVEGGEFAGTYLPLTAVWSLGVISGTVPAAYFGEELETGDQFADLSRVVHTYHYGRDVVSKLKMGTTGYRAYRDEPNVTALVVAKTAATAESVTESAAFDILHRSSAVSPLAGDSRRAGPHPLLAEGVLAHVIERATVEVSEVMPADLALPHGSSIGVGRVFEESARTGTATVVLRPGVDDPMGLAISEGARARIAEALAAGYVVIAPERAVKLGGEERVGWWLVDPATGATADQMDDGRGTELPQTMLLMKIVICGIAVVGLGVALVYGFLAVADSLTPIEFSAMPEEAQAQRDASYARNVGRAKRGGAGLLMAGGACGAVVLA
jgi:hypothetical protein